MNAFPPGTTIAKRYEVVKTLAGGMGTVHLCLDRQTDRPVALKTFKPEYLSNRIARNRFLREATVWIELGHHPHRVRAHQVQRIGDGREVYLVLEWIAQAEGKRDASLRAWLTPGKPLPPAQAMLFVLHIVRGMKHATTKRPGQILVHRDLKPANVLVGRDGKARVTDFGLVTMRGEENEGARGTEEAATLFGRFTKPLVTLFRSKEKGTAAQQDEIAPPLDWTQLTKRGHVPGTPPYMAPEQWAGGHLDVRADIYAFGCIVYEMVTGQRVVVGRDRHTIEQAHRTGQVEKLARRLPAQLSAFVGQCVAVALEKRYASWEEVEDVVKGVYQHVVGTAAPSEATGEEETRAERVTAGWSYMALGLSYCDLGKCKAATKYFEQAVKIGQVEQEQVLQGYGLGGLGTTYLDLGDTRRAIECYERVLAIMQDSGRRDGEISLPDTLLRPF